MKSVFLVSLLGLILILNSYCQDAPKQQNLPDDKAQSQQAQPQQPSQPPPLTEEQKAQIRKIKMDASLNHIFALQQAKYVNVYNYTAQFNYIAREEYRTHKATGEISVSRVNSGGKLMWLETNLMRKDVEKKIYLESGQLIEFDLMKMEAARHDITKKTPYFIQVPLRSGFTPDLVKGFELSNIDFALEGGAAGQPATNQNAQLQQGGGQSAGGNMQVIREGLTPETGAMGGRQATPESIKANPLHIYNQRFYHKLIFTTNDDKLKREIKLLEFWVNKDTFLIEHIELTRPNGTSQLIDLSDVKVNTDIPADRFSVSLDGFRVNK